MKRFLYSFFGLIVVASCIISCDKISQPVIIQTTLDTTLYPGNFYLEYDFPTFTQNTNTLKNALIEDYTGHQCTFCPAANNNAKSLEDANPGRVFVASIHAGADNDGISSFQEVNASGMYTRDFTTSEGTEMAAAFFQMSVGFNANPQGCINRYSNAGLFFLNSPAWGDMVDSVLNSPLDINLQSESNYFPSTNAVFLHVETEYINDLSGEYNIVVYALQNQIIDWQKEFGVGDIPDYDHHNVHIGNIFSETWGRTVSDRGTSAGTKIVTDFSYELPQGLTNNDMHFIIYVYDKETYEVLQVIDHHF